MLVGRVQVVRQPFLKHMLCSAPVVYTFEIVVRKHIVRGIIIQVSMKKTVLRRVWCPGSQRQSLDPSSPKSKKAWLFMILYSKQTFLQCPVSNGDICRQTH